MKIADKHLSNNMVMFTMNYAMCVFLSRLYVGKTKLFVLEPGIEGAIYLGIISGILFLLSFVLLQQNIKKNGAVLSATFMKLGVIIPTIMAMVFFHETPKVLQIVGIILAIGAIILIHFEKDASVLAKHKFLLVVMLLCSGFTDSMINIYDKVGNANFKDHYLFFNFAVALLLALILAIAKRRKPSGYDFFFGLLIGIPNYFSSKFLMSSLADLPAIVVYPVYSVTTIVVVSLISLLFFKERLSRQKIGAILIIFLSLILLNI